ncbi:MAG TPA: phosphate--AMP phosphotransferase, partial [Acidobacteriota bacterium]|nr:phosphate--AMP phosphotransferase [Acidobacteriota bacterium]
RLRHLEQSVREAGLPVLILFEGWDLAGKGGALRLLSERLDPRGFRFYPIYPPSEEEDLYPFLRRFWLRLPARGEIVLFDHSWYGRVLGERVERLCSKRGWQTAFQQINEFEHQLTADGTLFLKYWFHISKKEQRKRLSRYLKDPFEKWQVTPEVRRRHRRYKKYYAAVEEMLERTSTTVAPWILVEAEDPDFARIKVFQTCIDAIERMLAPAARKTAPVIRHAARSSSTAAAQVLEEMPTLLDRVDLSVKLTEKAYVKQLNEAQLRLRELQFEIEKHRIPVIVAYEGWDAAGKGGNITRLTEKLDPRGYEVYPIAAPSAEEKAHHYLWRFWKRLPPAGRIGIFDRSWYGRVLVERVEGLCTQEEWQRAYQEIREFEHQLVLAGSVFVKLWLHISKEEQLRRFREREKLAYKRHKITEEDWRNRQRWDDYHGAVVEMLYKTSTTYAPWTIVEGNCKWWARVKAVRTVVDQIEKQL